MSGKINVDYVRVRIIDKLTISLEYGCTGIVNKYCRSVHTVDGTEL